MVRVIIEHQAINPESVDKVISVIKEIKDEIMKCPGYITGETLIDSKDECSIIVISTWHNLDQWRTWSESDKCIELTEKEAPYLVRPLDIRECQYYTVKANKVWSTL